MNHTTPHPAASHPRPAENSADPIAEELRRYDEYLREVRGLAAGTREGRVRVVRWFLQERFAGCAVEIASLRPDHVRGFLARKLDAHCTRSSAGHLATALRSYLRYRSICGDRVGALLAVIASPVHWKLASLPRALKPDEARHLLAAFAGARRWPKRSYAMGRCALDMGLRACEIAHLMIADIDWQEGTVMLRGTKSLRQDILPLPMETGQALADYLCHERPATAHPNVFVRRIGGEDHPITSFAVQKVIKRACRRAGLPQYSAHALRHTLACRLVESGSSLKEVADILRHRSLSTTLIYAKLDTPKLAAVALPWPGSES